MKSLILAAVSVASLASAAVADPTIGYVAGSLTQSQITYGPWTLHQATGVNPHNASGIVPTSPFSATPPAYTGTGAPYAGLCKASGTAFNTNPGLNPMQPFYFPFVRRRGPILEGFFDYRPRNQQEATVAAISTDEGVTWRFTGEKLALNPYCPSDPTDPDNLYVNVNGVKTAYGADANSAGDNGLGHPVVLAIGGTQYIYTLDRANGHIDSDQLVVHALPPLGAAGNITTLPQYGFVSPLSGGGYPALDAAATHTTGLINPDAIMGTAALADGTTAVAYVEKDLNGDVSFPAAQICPKSPIYALTTLVNGKQRKTNDDVTSVRIAVTSDGINFTTIAAKATGLNDPTTVAPNGFRWLGSGSILKLANGHYGMFFGAGGCIDNDSDGFHFIGYAETVNVVTTANDLVAWHVVNGFDNPILSTDTVSNGTIRVPANPPVIAAHGNDLITLAQVAPFTPATGMVTIKGTNYNYPSPDGGYNSNFFSGRVYDPQPLPVNDHTITIVFAGYNTPQPSNNLGDYRTIGRFQLTFPAGYFSAANVAP